MIIYFGADHRGFALKEQLIKMVRDKGYEAIDCGAAVYSKVDDYPDFAAPVAQKVSEDPANRRGIVICGSGFGVAVAADKFPGIRAGLAMSADHIYAGRHDDDVNVLALAANFIDASVAEKITDIFLTTPFDDKEERYTRRVEKINRICE